MNEYHRVMDKVLGEHGGGTVNWEGEEEMTLLLDLR